MMVGAGAGWASSAHAGTTGHTQPDTYDEHDEYRTSGAIFAVIYSTVYFNILEANL